MIKPKEFKVNGTLVAVYPMNGVRTVVIRASLRAGSWYEKTKSWGAMHLMEHMFFQGVDGLKSNNDLEDYKERFAITNNAWTGGSDMEFWFRFPDVSLQPGIDLIEKTLFYPLFPDDRLAKEKSVIRQEYQDKWSNPNARFGRKIDNQIFGDNHIYTRDGIGEPDYVDSITREQLLDLHKKYFQPENMVISVVGAVDADNIGKLLTKIIPVRKSKKIELTPSKLNPGTLKIIHHEPGIEAADVNWNWIIGGLKQLEMEDRLKLWLASYILGSGGKSIIFKRLRQDLGIAYKAGWTRHLLPTVGFFSAWTSVDPKNIEIADREVRKILEEFTNMPIEKNKFKTAVNFLKLQTLMYYDSVDNIANYLINDLFWEGRIYSSEEISNTISKFTEKEIRMLVAKEVGGKEPFVSIMMGNAKK